MQISLNIDKTTHSSKPAGAEIGAIRNRLVSGRVTIEPPALAAIIESGGSFTPALMAGTNGASWQSQQVIVADIDNDETARDANGEPIKDETGHALKQPIAHPLTTASALALCEAAGVVPAYIYRTFSSSAALPKFRVVLVLDRPITTASEAENLTARFTNLFNSVAPGAADPTMKDAARIIFGSTPGSIEINSGSVTKLEALRALPDIPQPAPVRVADPEPYTPRRSARKYDDIKAQRRYDIENFDLLGYIKQTEMVRERKSGKTTFLNPCPVCGHNDDFSIDGHLWRCFSTSSEDDAGGSVIDYFIHRYRITEREALQKFDEMMGYEIHTPAADPAPQTDSQAPEETAEDQIKEHSARATLAALIDPEEETEQIPTGFAALDDFMDGGLYPGLYTLGAISSMGKTTFIVQLADQLAAAGNDILFFTLEMGAKELMARSISRYTRKVGTRETALTANQILINSKRAGLDLQQRLTLKNAFEKYGEEVAGRVWYFESVGDVGANDIRKAAENHLKLTGRTPIIFLDYLQIMKPIDDAWTEKRNTDKNVLELRKIAREYSTIVFAISTLNRGSYKGDIDLDAFKESGAIEYGSDVLLGLQPRGMSPGVTLSEQRENKVAIEETKLQEVRETELKVIKNRSGRTGKRIEFDYNTLFNTFTETQTDNANQWNKSKDSEHAARDVLLI